MTGTTKLCPSQPSLNISHPMSPVPGPKPWATAPCNQKKMLQYSTLDLIDDSEAKVSKNCFATRSPFSVFSKSQILFNTQIPQIPPTVPIMCGFV